MTEATAKTIFQHSLWLSLSERVGVQMGLHYPEEKLDDLKRGVAAAAPLFGMADADACVQRLLSEPLTRPHIEILARHLTVGETYFFREKNTFDILETQLLPVLLRERTGKQRRLSIWSAGCCTGEEAYSIAMTLAGTIPDLRDWHISILATDIDPDFLRKAALGIYSSWSFRDTPPAIRKKFFKQQSDGHFEIVPQIRNLVKFSYLNLAQDTYPSAENGTSELDFIFCRNVLMYFGAAHAKKVLQQLSGSLKKGGWLFLNPVEIPHGPLPQLASVHFPGAVILRKSSTAVNDKEVFSPVGPVPTQHMFVPRNAVQPPARPIKTDRAVARRVPATKSALRLQQAMALYDEGMYAAAALEIHAVLSRFPDESTALALLARTHANQGQLEEALTWCNKAVAADKLHPGWCYLLATILQELGRPEDAALAFRRTIFLDPDNALAHFGLGNLVRRQGQHEVARRHFVNALSVLQKLNPIAILPEFEGVTAGRLAGIIQSYADGKAPA